MAAADERHRALRDTIVRQCTPDEVGHLAWILACAVQWRLSAADVFAVLVSIQVRFGEVKALLEQREAHRRKVVPLRRE